MTLPAQAAGAPLSLMATRTASFALTLATSTTVFTKETKS